METADLNRLLRELLARVPPDAAQLLESQPPERIDRALAQLPSQFAARVASHLPSALKPARYAAVDEAPPDTIGELMEAPRGVLPPDTTVARAIDYLRGHEEVSDITYLYIAGSDLRLRGLVVMRELLLARPERTLDELMIGNPFRFTPEMKVLDAVKLAARRQYPVYPVCDAQGTLLGLVRGWRLFEQQAIEISAQSGTMVGLDAEERVHTPLLAALFQRHPWLQVNLFTAFLSALVVGLFAHTVERIVVLASFLPVLSCLAGNNGCQALAITLRGLTLGDLDQYPVRRLLRKELTLGALNGLGTGAVAGVAMYFFARVAHMPDPKLLGLIMLTSMTVACVGSCLLGTLVPLTLKRFGADPATASSIFVLSATDVIGMGFMLTLTTQLIPG